MNVVVLRPASYHNPNAFLSGLGPSNLQVTTRTPFTFNTSDTLDFRQKTQRSLVAQRVLRPMMPCSASLNVTLETNKDAELYYAANIVAFFHCRLKYLCTDYPNFLPTDLKHFLK